MEIVSLKRARFAIAIRVLPVYLVLFGLSQADRPIRQFGERRVEDGSLDAAPVDMQPSEEGEVEASARLLVGTDVEPVAVLKQAERHLQPLLDQCVVDVGKLDQAFSFALFDSQSVLALLEIANRQCPG